MILKLKNRLVHLVLSICFLLLFSRTLDAGFIDHFADKTDIGRNKVPNTGTSRILVIPVNLNTSRLAKLDLELIRQFFVDEPERVNFPGYWRVNSLGKLKILADVALPVNYKTCPLDNSISCTPKRKGLLGLVNGLPLIKEVLHRAKKESGLDFTRYDINGINQKPDGYIDGVVILMNAGWFGVALPFGIVDENQTVTIDGVKINMVAIASGPRYLGISIHEYGHLLGFADLYDEYKSTYGLQLSSMGNWKYDLRYTPLLDPFSKMQIGWANVIEISGEREILMAPAQSGTVYKMGSEREFFLAENRQANGPYDRMVTSPGISVYHVNMNRMPKAGNLDFIKTVVDCLNCRKWHPFIMNVQADGRYDLQYKLNRFQNRDLFRTGDAFLPDRERLPLSPSNIWFSSNYYHGVPSGISITDVDSDSVFPFIRARLKAPIINVTDSDLKSGGISPKQGRDKETENTMTDQIRISTKYSSFAAFSMENSCMAIDDVDLRILPVILLVLWLIFRPAIKRKVEKWYGKNDEAKDD